MASEVKPTCMGLIDDTGKPVNWKAIKNGRGTFAMPIPFLLAMQDRKRYCDYSVTQLSDDTLAVQRKRRVPYFVRPDAMMEALWGTALHKVLDADGFDTEQQLLMEIPTDDGIRTVGGTYDLVYDGTLHDYKSVSVGKLAYMLKGKTDSIEKWSLQLSCYRAMLRVCRGVTIDKAVVNLFIRDWRFSEYARTGHNLDKYPKMGSINIELKPVEETIKWMAEQVRRLVQAERMSFEDMPACDTWNGLRCNHYCDVHDGCPHKKESTR